MHKNATFRLWEARGQLWKPLAELRETLGEPQGGSGRIWEYQKKRKVVTKTISYKRYREILFQKVASGYLLHFVQDGSSTNALDKQLLRKNDTNPKIWGNALYSHFFKSGFKQMAGHFHTTPLPNINMPNLKFRTRAIFKPCQCQI